MRRITPWLILLLGCGPRRAPAVGGDPGRSADSEQAAVGSVDPVDGSMEHGELPGWQREGDRARSPTGATLRLGPWSGEPPPAPVDPLARLDRGPYLGGPGGPFDGDVIVVTTPDGDGLRLQIWGELGGRPVRVEAWLPDARFEAAWHELLSALHVTGGVR